MKVVLMPGVIRRLRDGMHGEWGDRIVSQLEYALELSRLNNGEYDTTVAAAAECVENALKKEGAITKTAAEAAEKLLTPLSAKAKETKLICAAHAHIDLNWQWGYPETVGVTLDTFRTMLDLMDEYPDYKFSQSQAAIYRIVEKHDSEMLDEIRRRIQEGRWEVTAGAWVENDKNMPNGESLARHILYTKRYLSNLFDIKPDDLSIEFQPDTFGHNLNVPEILHNGGIKYFYHVRGYEKHSLYRWRSPSGNEVLAFWDPLWYSTPIDSSIGLYALEFVSSHDIDTALKVYGVSDHGGGPTRNDLEKIMDMGKWPVFPEIRFGTYSEYFKIVEKIADKLPVVEQELNFLSTGCYTSQSRLKMANRISEAKLNEAEAFSAINAVFANGGYNRGGFERAWTDTLFSQFHDILTGVGIIDTREYSMGLFQKIVATTNTEQAKALRNIASKIDTSSLIVEELPTCSDSEGAGVGYGIANHGIPQTERGRGKTRIFHVFNPSPEKRNEPVELTVWDWNVREELIEAVDGHGQTVDCQPLPANKLPKDDSHYNTHKNNKVIIDATIPPYGYNTYILKEGDKPKKIVPLIHRKSSLANDPDETIILPGKGGYNRLEKCPPELSLKNDLIEAEFDSHDFSLISLTDKETGKKLVSDLKSSGVFRYIKEDDLRGSSAWTVGRYISCENINQKYNCEIKKGYLKPNALRQWFMYEIEFEESRLTVTVSLDRHATSIRYDVECDWQEKPVPHKHVPQLNFHVSTAYPCESYKYDIPFGTIERTPMDRDAPGNSFIAAPSKSGDHGLMIVTNSKYGFRGLNNSMAVSLIRSTCVPDPYPELGIHKFRLHLGVVNTSSNKKIIQNAYILCHPMLFMSGTAHKGDLLLENGFIELVSGNCVLSAIKLAEDKKGDELMIVRGYETEGSRTTVIFNTFKKVTEAYFMDLNENRLEKSAQIIKCEGNSILFEVEPNKIFSIGIKFRLPDPHFSRRGSGI